MKEYEITYMANPELDEAAKDKLDEAIDGAIANTKGEILMASPQTGAPGSRRRLNYPIDGHQMSWLRTIQANLDPQQVQSLRAKIRKQEGTIRVAIVQTKKREEVSAAIFERAAEREKQEETKDTEKKDTTPVTMEEVEEKIEKALDEEVK